MLNTRARKITLLEPRVHAAVREAGSRFSVQSNIGINFIAMRENKEKHI